MRPPLTAKPPHPPARPCPQLGWQQHGDHVEGVHAWESVSSHPHVHTALRLAAVLPCLAAAGLGARYCNLQAEAAGKAQKRR